MYSLFISVIFYVNGQDGTSKIAKVPKPGTSPGRSNQGKDGWSLLIKADTLSNKASGQRTQRPNQAPKPGGSPTSGIIQNG